MQSSSVNHDRHTIATYLTDMLALERHINAPIESQHASAEQQASAAMPIIARIHAIGTSHIAALEAQVAATGDTTAGEVKSAWAELIGGAAAALNQLRSTKVSKSLRDDYTALGLASISYTMLHATAAGLGDAATAALAKKHLEDYTPIIVDISTAIPAVVLAELAADGENVQSTAAQLTQQATKEAWSEDNTR